MRKFLKRFPFNKLFVSLFVILYTFVPYAQAIGTVIEDTSTGVDTSEDILDEGISDPEEIANPNVLEEEVVVEEVVEEPPFVYEDGVYTVNSVGLEEYVYPDNKDVRVRFTNVTEEGNLVISRVTLTEEEKELLNTSDDYGWDISSSMSNGSFKYDLTLPNNTESNDVEVKYTEDGSNYENIDNEIVNENVIEIKGLEHFTTFVVVNSNLAGNGNVCTVASITGTCYDTIQQAINMANDGDTVNVTAGTYTQSLSINKKINLIGAGSSVTTIKPNIVGGAVITVNVVTGPMTIEGFTIDALDYTNESGIYIQNSSSIVTVKNNIIKNFTDKGVLISNSNNNVVQDNTIEGSSIGSFAGVYLDDQSGNNTIDYNAITLATTGTGHLYDIWFAGTNSKDNIVINNTINGGLRAFQQDGGVSGTTTFSGNNVGPSEWGVSINGGNAIVTSNTITNSLRPIEFWGANDITITDNVLDGTTHDFINIGSFTGTLNPIQHNAFLNMGGAKLHNRTTNDIIATENYWGDLDPSDNILNSGGGSINYSPWWGENYVNSDHSTAWTWYTNDSIQEAIDVADPGDTVNVTAGTYKEQVIINKSLTLQGAGSINTIIEAPVSPVKFKFPESSKYWEPVVFAFGGTADTEHEITGTDTIAVTITGFTVDGNNRVPSGRSAGILLRNANGTISSNIVKNMSVDEKETFGIVVYGDSEVTISDNDVSGYARGGIGVNGDGGGLTDPRAVITYNTVTGPGKDEDVTWAPNGIQIGWGATGEITGNTVSGNGWPGTDWTGSGILVYASSSVEVDNNTVEDNETGIAVSGTSNNTLIHYNTVDKNNYGISIQDWSVNTTIENNTIKNSIYDGIDICNFYGNPPTGTVIRSNTITGNNTVEDGTSGGIWIDDGVDGNEVSINLNNIVSNNQFGVLNTSTTNVVDATKNWWGFSDGPSGKGSGSGDSISDNVKYCPWLDAEDGNPVGPCLGDLRGRTFIDNNWNGLLLSSDGDYSSGMKDGFTVRLYDKDWNPLEQQTTNTTGEVGQFHFANLDNTNNTYYVCGAYRDGYFYSPAQIGQGVIHTNGNPVTGYEYAEIVSNESTVPDESPVCWEITLDSETDGAYLGLGYTQEAPGTPTQTGYKDQNGVSYSCTDDFTKMPRISVHWTDESIGTTPPDNLLKYQRQYSRDEDNWSGNEIYSNPYTDLKSFGYGEVTHYSRVRSFYDLNMNNQYDMGEPVSIDWSNICGITYDDTIPTITLDLPVNNSIQLGVVDLKATCNEECDYITFWWREESESYSQPSQRYHTVNANNTEFNWSINTLNAEKWDGTTYTMTDGTYYFYAAGKDLAGNWARSNDVKVVVDNTPPIVAITSPNDGGLYNTDVNLSGTVTDVNPHHYWLQITKDGENLNIADITGTQSAIEFSTTLTEDGEYHVTFAARDAAGGTSSSGNRSKDINISFTIDKTGPQPPVLTSDPVQYVKWGNVTRSWLPSSSTDVDYYMYKNITNGWTSGPYDAGQGQYSITHSTGNYDRVFEWQVAAVDYAGNETWSEDTYKVVVDNTLPTKPVITNSPDNSYTNINDITINWTDGDDTGSQQSGIKGYILGYEFIPANEGNPITWNTGLKEWGNPYTHSGTYGDGQGTYIFYIKTVDKAGNESPVSNTFTITYDATAPIIEITTPLEETNIKGIVDIKGSVEDINPDHYYLVIKNSMGEIEVEPGIVYRDDPFTNELLYQWDTTQVNDGQYTIYLTAEDAAGNVESEEDSKHIISVTVDNTPPVTTLNEELEGIFTNDPILIEGETTDNLSGVDFINLYYNLSSNSVENWILIGTVPTIDNSDNNSPFAWNYTWTPPQEGTYDIKASATDILGNEEQSAYIYDVTYDTTDPEVLLDLVLGVLNITAEDLLSGIYTIQVSKDDKTTWQDYTSNMNLNDLVGNQPGTYTIYIKVTDNAGNTTDDYFVTFTIPSPTPEVLGITSPLNPTPVKAYSPTYGTGGYLLSQTDEQNTEEEEITKEETITQDSSEVKGEEDNEEQNSEEEPTEEEKTKWWVYPLVIIPVLTIFLILWKRRKEDNEPQL